MTRDPFPRVEADNLNAAKARLARIETDILNNFKVLGAAARPMTGYERLEALRSLIDAETRTRMEIK